MKDKNKVCCKFKVWVNEYGTHIRVSMHEQTKVVTDEEVHANPNAGVGELITNITYHVSTNSASVGKILVEGWTEDDALVWFADLLKEDWMQDYIKCQAHINEFTFKPVWCKQTGKHYC